MSKGKRRAVIGAVATIILVAVTGLVIRKDCYHGAEPWTCTLIMDTPDGLRCRMPRVDVCATDLPLAMYLTAKRLSPFPRGFKEVDMLCNQQRFQTDSTFSECKISSANTGERNP